MAEGVINNTDYDPATFSKIKVNIISIRSGNNSISSL
jgi:hypothetical protein